MTTVLLTLCLCFSACRPAPKSSASQIELEFWTLQMLTFKGTLEPMFAEFERTHPGVRIKWVDIPFSEGEKRTLTAMMSSSVPDVVNLNPDFSAVLASRNTLTDMGQALTHAEQDVYLPVAWKAATLDRPDQRTTFGLPWYITSSVTLYNDSLLKKAGFDVPPDTYQALPAFSRQIHEKSAAYALMPTIAERGNFLKEMKKIGVPLYAGGQTVFATPQAKNLLEMFVYLYKDGYIPAEALTESHRAAVDRYQAGTLALLLTGPNFLNIVQENAPAVFRQTRVAPQFPADAPFKDFSLMLLVVPNKSRHPKEAVAFARFITNGKNQLALANAAPVLPSVTKALKAPYFQMQDAPALIDRARSISAAQLLAATEAYQIQPDQNRINAIMDHCVQLALLGKLPPAEALERAQQEINQVLEAD